MTDDFEAEHRQILSEAAEFDAYERKAFVRGIKYALVLLTQAPPHTISNTSWGLVAKAFGRGSAELDEIWKQSRTDKASNEDGAVPHLTVVTAEK